MKELVCKNCGASLQVEDGNASRFVTCPYCGTTYAVDDLLPPAKPAQQSQTQPPSQTPQSSQAAKMLAVAISLIMVLISGAMALLLNPQARKSLAHRSTTQSNHAKQHIKSTMPRVNPVRVCPGDVTGDGRLDYVVFDYGRVGLVDGASGKLVYSSAKIPRKVRRFFCMGHAMIALEVPDGTYRVIGFEKTTRGISPREGSIEPPDGIQKAGSGDGCGALWVNEKWAAFFEPPLKRITECKNVKWHVYREHNVASLVGVDEVVRFGSMYYRVTDKRNELLRMEARKERPGRKKHRKKSVKWRRQSLIDLVRRFRRLPKVFTRDLKYRGVNGIKYGIVHRNGVLYLAVEVPGADENGPAQVILAMDATDGTIKWRKLLPQSKPDDIINGFFKDRDRLVVSYARSGIYALDPSKHRVIWHYRP